MCAAFMATARRIHGDLDANFTMDLAQNTGIAMDAAQNRRLVVARLTSRREHARCAALFRPAVRTAVRPVTRICDSLTRFVCRLTPSQKFIV